MRAGGLAAALVLLLLVAAPSQAPARPARRLGPADRAGLRAFLQAQLVYDRALLSEAGASVQSVRALAGGLSGECAGVLAGAPHQKLGSLFEAPPEPTLTPRQEGEQNRHDRQYDVLREELAIALRRAQQQPVHDITLTYAHSLRALHFGTPLLERFLHAAGAALEGDIAKPVPQVCADMKGWVASGYRTLTPASRTLEDEAGALFASIAEHPLALFELATPRTAGRAFKQLRSQLAQVDRALAAGLKPVKSLGAGVSLGLGLEREPQLPLFGSPPKGSTLIGRGRTLFGHRYRVFVLPAQSNPATPITSMCKVPVAIFVTEKHGSSSNEICMSRRPPSSVPVECANDRMTIEAQTSARTRRVRLALSDGRQITSRVAVVPARLGGHGGIYFQELPRSSMPVSLTELDGRGHRVGTIKLVSLPNCSPSFKPPQVTVRPIVKSVGSGGPPFQIVGIFSVYEHKSHFLLQAEVTQEGAGVLGTIGSSSEGASGGFVVQGRPGRVGDLYAVGSESGCKPREYAVVYGLLKHRDEVVLARTANGLVPLRHARIPRALHQHARLVYLELDQMPQELIVRNRFGRTVLVKSLAGAARAARETCEGESES